MDEKQFSVNDKVLVAMKSRSKGYQGGWQTENVVGRIMRIGRVNYRVCLDQYFFGFCHWVKPERVFPFR